MFSLSDDEQDKYDDTLKNQQNSERYERILEGIDALDTALEYLQVAIDD